MTECRETPAMVIGELLKRASRRLAPSPTARLDAELLLGFVLDCDRVALIRDRERCVEPTHCATFERLVDARLEGQPLAQLRGSQEFWSLDLYVNQAVLVPRPETELLVNTTLELLAQKHCGVIADLGTGSGAVALAVASELPLATIIAIERSAPALEVARINRERCKLTNVQFIQGDWLHAIQAQTFDVILANPPYVAASDPLLLESSLRYEPRLALAAGADGLEALTAIARQASLKLRAEGWLVMEHGATQAAPVRGLLEGAGFVEITTLCDLAGLDRVTRGQKKGTTSG